jgi:UDP-N-acetylglucosamine acyltransferase
MIHPTALIHPRAEVDSSVDVGPYAVIDEGVRVGPDCRLASHVHLSGQTTIGRGNVFFTGAVVGSAPQDLKFKGEVTRLQIGDRNTFREYLTVNRSTTPEGLTVIGSDNLLMAHCHVAHDCILGNHVILVNGCLLAGHVEVGDRAVLSGHCLVHQFVRIGTLSMMQGGSAVSRDLPPYCTARRGNTICGINVIGLRRAGFNTAQRLELRKLYHLLFRSGKVLADAAAEAIAANPGPEARVLLDFIASSKRGVVVEISAREAAEGEESDGND